MNIILFLLVYIIAILFYSIWLYNQVKMFYKPLFYIKNGKKIDVHSLYPEFAVKDKLSFIRIFIGNLLFFPWKILLPVLISMVFNLHLNYYNKTLKNPTTDPKERKIITSLTSFYTNILFILMNFKIIEKKVEYEKVYKKYLGEDYDFNQQDYSIMISNHIGFYEIIYNMVYNYTGFIAKKDVANYYFVGVLAKGINCLFVDRESEESRKKIFEELEERQKLYYKKELLTPLCLFPEGTTTTGNHILKFKKGAFFALLPIKPQILDIYHEDEFHLAIGVAPVVSNWLRSGNYSRHRIYHIDLPVIKPTKFMFEKYKDLGNEKWEIFSEVTRKIMCEVSGLKPSNKNYRDMKKYLNSIINGKYEEDIDIKQD